MGFITSLNRPTSCFVKLIVKDKPFIRQVHRDTFLKRGGQSGSPSFDVSPRYNQRDSPKSAEVPNPMLMKPTTPKELTRHLAALLTRHGNRGEWIVAKVQHLLQVRYNHPNPIQTAIDAVKPVVKYYKSKSSKGYIPLVLFPRTAETMAMRWLIHTARTRTYVGGRPDIVRGLADELDAIIQGTSCLFRKRFDTHRNPN